MLKNITDVMHNVDTNDLDIFLSKTDASLVSISDIKETKVDYAWLDVLEDTIPNIDLILRNPRRFIIQEEDVVIVEKARKIGQESIRHLSQHSENIRDIKKNGEVMPSKLLNIRKEDTTDIYENRFIYTLVRRLEEFMQRQLANLNVESKREINRDVTYKANTVLEDRKLNIELKMHEESEIDLSEKGQNYYERIMACYEMVSGFKNTEVIKSLIGCTPVRDPIRKTNAIKKETNLQKAFLLWENLNNFEYRDPKVVNYDHKVSSKKETKDEFTLAFYINSNAVDENKERLLEYKDTTSKLNKLINEYIYEENSSKEEFDKKVSEFYKNAIDGKKEREDTITNIYTDFIESHNNKIKEINGLFN